MDASSARGSTGALSSSAASSVTAAGMHHSLSTPAGVDGAVGGGEGPGGGGGARTPPATPRRAGKMLAVRVHMLDDSVTIFQVQAKALGSVLFEQVCKQLHLLEADYFGLEYSDAHGTKYWLDLQKPISRQLGLSLVDPLLYFCVKFYTPDPGQLEEEYTRYLFCLQVKRDLTQGLMQCNENTAALMASYIVQAECGDYVAEDYPDHTYLSSYKFVPQQDREMERKIMENHKKHAGQSPAEADLNLLETARRCELYGMKMHPAKDHDNISLNLAVAHMGILVFQNHTKINTFSWAKIRKISFKRKRFLIKLHPEGYGYYKDTVEFFFEGRNECKNFWKKCVENHGFFRCSSVKHVSRHKTRVLSRGSSFRYSGKTQKQIVEFVRDNYVKRQTFQRSHSFRHSSAHSSASNMHSTTVGNSISAHPLLPLADSKLSAEASRLSASLGSMGGAGAPASPTTKSAYRPPGTAMSWSTVDPAGDTTKPPTLPRPPPTAAAPRTSSPVTTRSSPTTSAASSPTRDMQHPLPPAARPASPLAVRAAVHKADTGVATPTHIITRTPSNHKSEGSLDYSASFTNNLPSQTQSQNDLGSAGAHDDDDDGPEHACGSAAAAPSRQFWRRSASCRDLYDFSFEDSGRSKRRAKPPKPIEKAVISLDERKLESPITVYDDHHALYSTSSRDSSLEIQQDIMVPDEKVYSSSYPGTTSYVQESLEDPGNYDLRDSQDDLSHDSYELIEKSEEDYSTSGEYKEKKKMFNTRSCSLDSGNYLPSDSESEHGKHKYKSSSDVHQDLLLIDDPRDFPREITPRKSDGCFYKAFKQSSRTSSLESKNDYYEPKTLKSAKKRREHSFGSRTSSQESKSDYETKRAIRKNKSADNLDYKNGYFNSRNSSIESKSEYFDANSKAIEEAKSYKRDYDRKINFERNYGTQVRQNRENRKFQDYGMYPDLKETSHVHSISLQNVETEQNKRTHRILVNLEQNTVPRTQKSYRSQIVEVDTHNWQQEITGLPPEPENWSKQQSGQRSTESESNIFSFDEDRIQSLQESSDFSDHGFSVVPNIDTMKKSTEPKKTYRDIFMEIEPRLCHDLPMHQPIERTKSDPNSLARQRLNSHSRRLLLMHQKSIDLTPAESSDEDYLYKQIPSAPPITKFKGTHFELPTAEFGHFDILKREIEGQKTKFEVPKSQFEILGAKTQSDFINLPPKDEEITYILHKRHIMNGTAKAEEVDKHEKSDVSKNSTKDLQEKMLEKPKIKAEPEPEKSFLFTQNIDLSKVDPITLEVDKSQVPIQHISSPKRDITHIDPVLLEALNSKLSQIESDSPTSSKTESLKPQHKILSVQIDHQAKADNRIPEEPLMSKIEENKVEVVDAKLKLKDKIKTDIKPKRVIKPRMQPGKKGGKSNKTKVRITSFSSDDESLDSDDVFGSAEATPTRIEFSPPQMRKEMESILKFESERKYLQYTMSSTEVEGSPPTTRKKVDKNADSGLDPNVQPELRRISERSFSIPSSEDEFNIKTTDMQPVFIELSELKTVEELDDKSIDETLKEELQVMTIDDEREREKALLQAEIENDLKNLRVPSKTKLTEIASPTLRSKGHSPLLFAHARLNLSEGSAITLLQKQQALESPLCGRRARSLDAPVIPVSKLPPLNAFSSKDDTVEEEEDQQQTDRDSGLENNLISDKSTEGRSDTDDGGKTEIKIESFTVVAPLKQPSTEKETDQIVPDLNIKPKKQTQVSAKPALKPKLPPKAPAKGIARATPKFGKEPRSIGKDGKDRPKAKPTSLKIQTKGKLETRAKIITQKAASADEETIKSDSEKPNKKSLSSQSSLMLPEIKRTKSQEIETSKKTVPKTEKAKSLEKLELRRMGSKERTKSQEETEDVISKRRELQQMLYETAIKQTKTLKSPVKDVLPVFPQVEEMVRERHGKLEISINTIEPNVSLEEAIIITKSPKKLDKKMDKKLTKSLELNLTDSEEPERVVLRLGKSLDLDNRPKESENKENEFDFKPETIQSMQIKSEQNGEPLEGTVESEIDKIILEGTSLDVWLSMDNHKDPKLEHIKIIQKSDDFFEEGNSKPPDLNKSDTKSSSDSTSLEKMSLSLGNSLDIKYIDDSGDSSYKSEKEVQLVAELQKASNTVSKFIKRKLENRKQVIKEDSIVGPPTPSDSLVKITSEDESLTEVSELKGEIRLDENLLTVAGSHKDALQKLSIERSRSEDTGSWMTVECEEYVGTESSLDYDNVTLESPEKPAQDIEQRIEENRNLLCTDHKPAGKFNLLKRSSDQSRSSDTTGSWTSGEKDISPSNIKETDDSSGSCSMGRAIGLSQTIEKFGTRDQIDRDRSSYDEPPKSPRSPRSPRICELGRAFTIDEGSQKLDDSSSSDEPHDIPNDLIPIQEAPKEGTDLDNGVRRKAPYPFEEKWSNESELSQRLHKKLSKKMSSGDRNSMSSADDSLSDRRKNNLEKPSLLNVEKLSSESRNSLDTESSSGSFGAAARMAKSGDIPKELSSTWKPFPLDSSGSESFEDNLLPPDQDLDKNQEYFLVRDNSGDFVTMSDVYYKSDNDATPTKDDTDLPDDLANFPANFGYPCLTSITSSDILGNYSGGGAFLSRTLSRISERSTNSEKSSLEDSTKGSTQSDSLNDESMASSNPQVSFSSESPSHAHGSEQEKKTPTNEKPESRASDKTNSKRSDMPSFEQMPSMGNILQRQISDDRRTSAEMAELSIDDIEIISERGLRLKRQGSDDTIIDEECFEEPKVEKQSSQDSEDWPLPEIPQQGQKMLLAMHEVPSSDTSQLTTQVTQLHQPQNKNIPKTFGLRGSIKSQDSEQWPSPPSSVFEAPIVSSVETYYMTPPEEAYKVTLDSNTNTANTCDDSNSDDYRTLEELEKTHTYENVATGGEHISDSISESLSAGPTGIKIVLEEKNMDSNSDDDLNLSNLNDDVFVDAPESTSTNTMHELRPPTALRRSTASDDSRSDKKSSPKGSHSSYSDEECTSSMGTNLEDGTVRYALKPTKCTHSSHSEDTSIALSLSEWSNSTNTVKFQNLSSNSGTTKSSSGLKSDENSLTDIAQSISEWSSSNSNTLKAQQTASHPFQKLSSTTSTGDSTLTDLIPTISEWSTSDAKSLVTQQFFPERNSAGRLGSSVDIEDISLEQKSPKNIPSEDLALLAISTTLVANHGESKHFGIKSTERPIIIPMPIHSDTDKSSSSIEQKTIHIQKYDKDKQRYLPKQQQQQQYPPIRSTERPVKVPLKLSKCSPYYSSSLSSESTPLASTSPVPPINKTATVPLTRVHRKPVSRSLCQAKSPPSENDSTSSVESPKSKAERERRGYRRRRQMQSQRKVKADKEHHSVDEYYFVEHEQGLTEYNEYLRERSMEEMASNFQYEGVLAEDSPVMHVMHYAQENLEEGYYPDGDSQSGSDIFRMERDEDDRFDAAEGFDVTSIPPPLLEDDFESDPTPHI